MSEETYWYENLEEFYKGIKEDIPSVMDSFPEEEKIKRTIVVPKVFDMLLNRKLRADLLRFHGVELNYSDLLVGFALIGIAHLTSENLAHEIAGDLDILDAFDEARKKKQK
jgi:hypothetical protein